MNGKNTDCKLKTLVVGNLQICKYPMVSGLAQFPAIGITIPARKSVGCQNDSYSFLANHTLTKPGKD
jgi:hypothetical protein